MKITQLLNEMETPSSSTTNATNSAPKFGRSDKFLEEKEETVEECSSGGTGAGSVASVAAPMGGVKRRGQGSMFQGIQTSEKYPNSKAVKEGKNSELDSLYDQYDELDYDGNSESDKEKMRHIQQKIKDLKANEKKVNESQINEVDPRNFDSDVDYYAARNAPAKPRYRGTSSPGVNPDDEAYFREIFRKKRLAAQQAERTADHDRLATGTNEGLESDSELKTWQVVIFNNYYAGKYSDYRGRYYYVLASSPQEAKQVVLDNADGILQELLAMKSHNGKKILPRGSAVRITPDRIGKIEDGTVAGRMSTAGYKKMFGPQGLMMVKLSGGAVQDIQGQEQPVDEASFDYTMKDMGNDYAGFPSNHSMKHKFLSRIQPEKQQLYKDKINNTHRFEDLINLFNVAKQRGDIIEQGASQGTMGLNASLEQHADDKMKELGHKFKPVAEGSDDNEPFDYEKWKASTVKPRKPRGYKEAEFIAQQQKEINRKRKEQEQGVAEGSLNEFAPNGFNGDDGEEFNPRLAKMAYDEGVVKGVSLADGATLERAMAINDWDKHDGGIYGQHFAKGFKAGRMNKINHDNKQYNLNLKLNKDGSVSHGEQGVAEDESQPVKYRATVEYGPTAADAHFVTVTASSTEEAEAKVEAWCKKKGVRNPMITINGADKPVAEEKQRLDPKCWKGYKKQGTKVKGGVRVNNCVPVSEGEGNLEKALDTLGGSWSGWYPDENQSDPNVKTYWYDDGEGGHYASGNIEHNLKTGQVTVDFADEYNDEVKGTFNSIGDAMRALRGGYPGSHGGKAPNFDRLGQRTAYGPDDLRKTDRTGRKGTIGGGYANKLKGSIQANKGRLGPKGVLPESDISEDKLAQDLYKDFQIFKKGADKDIGSKAKDKDISNKATDKDIVAKEGFGDTIKKKAKQFSRYMTEPNSPHNNQVRSRAKNIDKIRKQEEKKSVFEKDPEAMREFERSGGYKAGIDVMGWQVGWAAAKHARGDTMKQAFQKLYYGGGSSFPFSERAFKLAWVAYNKHYGPQGNLEEMDGDSVGRDGSTDAEKKQFTAKPITSQQAQDKALDTLKQVLSKPENMNVLKRLKNK